MHDSGFKRGPNTMYVEEEMLVVYYVTVLMMMWKVADAQKALSEYMSKKQMSTIALANLQRLEGLILLINANQNHDSKDLKLALKKFTQARMNFSKMKNTLGSAVCSLAISKLYFEKIHSFTDEMEEN